MPDIPSLPDVITTRNDTLIVDDPDGSVTGKDTVSDVLGLALGSDVTFDNASFDVLSSTGGQDLLNEIDQRLLDARATGVRYGGAVTINGGDNTLVDVAAGAGAILDLADPENPVYTPVVWAASAGIDPPDSTVSHVYVTSGGTVTISAGEPTQSERRSRIILGVVSTVTGAVVTGIAQEPVPIQQPAQQVRDIMEAIGRVRISGASLAANGTNLRFDVTSGRILSPGANFQNDANDPHTNVVASAVQATFQMATQSGPDGSNTQDLDVGFYDVGGTRTAIPGVNARAVIYTVYRFDNGNIRVLYGQDWHPSVTDAVAAIATRSLTVPTGFAENGFVLGYIVARKNATDLSNTAQALFVPTDQFGNAGGGTSAAPGEIKLLTRSITGTTDTVTSTDNNTQIFCENTSGLTLTVNSASEGVSCVVSREDASVTLAAGAGVTIQGIGGTSGTGTFTVGSQYGSITLRWKSDVIVHVDGDLVFT